MQMFCLLTSMTMNQTPCELSAWLPCCAYLMCQKILNMKKNHLVIAYCCIFNGKPNPEKMSWIADSKKMCLLILLYHIFTQSCMKIHSWHWCGKQYRSCLSTRIHTVENILSPGIWLFQVCNNAQAVWSKPFIYILISKMLVPNLLQSEYLGTLWEIIYASKVSWTCLLPALFSNRFNRYHFPGWQPGSWANAGSQVLK